jgi:hypothetical protein
MWRFTSGPFAFNVLYSVAREKEIRKRIEKTEDEGKNEI